MKLTASITGYRFLQDKKYYIIKKDSRNFGSLYYFFKLFKAYFMPSARLFVAFVIAVCAVTG